MSSACSWPVTVCGTHPAYDGLAADVKAEVDAWAVDRLWKWSGQRFGSCPVIIRPCKITCAGDWQWPLIRMTGAPLLDDTDIPLYTDGGSPLTSDGTLAAVINTHCGSCPGDCSCTALSEVLLPGPVTAVIEVLINGEPLSPDAYRIDDWARLVRVDGGEWPGCQDLTAAYDEPGAWSVEYIRGQELPPGAGIVAGVLAVEYAKYICGDKSCQLPQRMQTVTRQGVTVVAFDNFDSIREGGTGIWIIDDWLNAQIRPRGESTVYTPDIPRQRVTTWTASSIS